VSSLAWGIAIAIAMSLIGAIRVAIGELHARQTFVSFGKTSLGHVDSSRVLFLEYAKQQRWAFGLLWFTLAIAVVLTTGILLEAMSGLTANLAVAREMSGLTLDACLAGGAGRLYHNASRRLEKAAKDLGR